MKRVETELEGAFVVEPDIFGDARGFFMELWNQRRYAELGLDLPFVQDNLSFSRKGTLRGLHFQNPSPQGKLVSVLHGSVFDVAVDLRTDSDTFGKWTGVELSAENKRQFFVPHGFAHGFVVVSDTALFHYKCTEFYDRASEGAVRWNDPSIGIKWPVSDPILSQKDAEAPFLDEIPHRQLF